MEGHSSEEFRKGIMRFYVPPGFIFMDKGVIEVRDKKELHHIIDVMRLTRDTSVTIFDGLGMEYSGKIKRYPQGPGCGRDREGFTGEQR